VKDGEGAEGRDVKQDRLTRPVIGVPDSRGSIAVFFSCPRLRVLGSTQTYPGGTNESSSGIKRPGREVTIPV
jgi:hypothetical protein